MDLILPIFLKYRTDQFCKPCHPFCRRYAVFRASPQGEIGCWEGNAQKGWPSGRDMGGV
jgi:hypothetical protein